MGGVFHIRWDTCNQGDIEIALSPEPTDRHLNSNLASRRA